MEKAHVKARKLLGQGVIGDVITFNVCCGFDGSEKLDMVQNIMNRKVVETTCRAVTPDKAGPEGDTKSAAENRCYILRLDNGIIGTMTVNQAFCRKEKDFMIVYGIDGTMKINEDPDFPVTVIDVDGDRICYKWE